MNASTMRRCRLREGGRGRECGGGVFFPHDRGVDAAVASQPDRRSGFQRQRDDTGPSADLAFQFVGEVRDRVPFRAVRLLAVLSAERQGPRLMVLGARNELVRADVVPRVVHHAMCGGQHAGADGGMSRTGPCVGVGIGGLGEDGALGQDFLEARRPHVAVLRDVVGAELIGDEHDHEPRARRRLACGGRRLRDGVRCGKRDKTGGEDRGGRVPGAHGQTIPQPHRGHVSEGRECELSTSPRVFPLRADAR